MIISFPLGAQSCHFDSPAIQHGTFQTDVSTHPFTEAMDLNDVRITTRYEGTDFKKSRSSAIHELVMPCIICNAISHCLLLRLKADLRLRSMNLSQGFGRILWQKPAFCSIDTPLIRKQVSFANQATDDELYLYFNNVKSDYIRVDADEVTYNLHIVIRYEIEKKIFEDERINSEIPEFWNDRTVRSCLE